MHVELPSVLYSPFFFLLFLCFYFFFFFMVQYTSREQRETVTDKYSCHEVCRERLPLEGIHSD